MQLPKFILSYSLALLSAPWRFTLVYLSFFSGTSHDFLTRGLQQKYPWKKILQILLSNHLLSDGYLIIDETDVDKSFGEKVPCLGFRLNPPDSFFLPHEAFSFFHGEVKF